MRILFLGTDTSPILKGLRADTGLVITCTMERIGVQDIKTLKPDCVVSHGYRFILKQNVLDMAPAINCHIAMLPWNRGADPNFWSWYEDTPKGVSIHRIDSGIDTGDILAQAEVSFDGSETLGSSYAVLQSAMAALFSKTWPSIRDGHMRATPQRETGSFHYARQFQAIKDHFPLGWDTPVNDVVTAGRYARMTANH